MKLISLMAIALIMAGCAGGPGTYMLQEKRNNQWVNVGTLTVLYIAITDQPIQVMTNPRAWRMNDGSYYTPQGEWRLLSNW